MIHSQFKIFLNNTSSQYINFHRKHYTNVPPTICIKCIVIRNKINTVLQFLPVVVVVSATVVVVGCVVVVVSATVVVVGSVVVVVSATVVVVGSVVVVVSATVVVVG